MTGRRRYHYLYSFAHAQRGDTAQAAAYRDKMNLVLATIESSGDGLTERPHGIS